MTAQRTPLESAVSSEAELAARAAKVRGDAVGLTAALFLELLPLLRQPIPAGFIKSIGVVTGKPYASTGISSVQVQVDRMDAVLTPLGWQEEITYHEGGKLAQVIVRVVTSLGGVLAERESWGGVDRGSTTGNLYKGSYTNAAKVAFARIGPGHEVYVGATDLDPDVHEGVANLQEAPAAERVSTAPASDRRLTEDEQFKIVCAFEDAGIDLKGMQMFLTAIGAANTETLTVSQAFALRAKLDDHVTKGGGS